MSDNVNEMYNDFMFEPLTPEQELAFVKELEDLNGITAIKQREEMIAKLSSDLARLRELLGEVVEQNKTHFDHRQRYPDWNGLISRIQSELKE